MLKKLLFGCFAFAVLSLTILNRPAWKLLDFDQGFYVTIAYDLDKHGVFSNGPFAKADSTLARPPPGMFFGPLYPTLVLVAMKLDPRFAAAVRCAVEADRGHRDQASCEAYALPMRLLNAFLLALGLIAIAGAAEIIVGRKSAFLVAGLSAVAGVAAESAIFSYVMTESAIFAIYSVFALQMLLAWKTGQARYFIFAGGLLGLLCLTKPSFVILFPAVAALSLLWGYRLAKGQPHTGARLLAFGLTFALVLGAWAGRNAISVGKFALTEEYGAVALIERFAYDDMTLREALQAFPYCLPGVGDLAFDRVYGTDSMHRFVYPIIGGIALEEMRARWWRYLLTTLPLAWCGMWAGWLVSLILVPAFAIACVRAFTTGQPLLLLYAAPALTMLALHAAVGNHYTRYNLILIGPYAAGLALLVTAWWEHRRDEASRSTA